MGEILFFEIYHDSRLSPSPYMFLGLPQPTENPLLLHMGIVMQMHCGLPALDIDFSVFVQPALRFRVSIG